MNQLKDFINQLSETCISFLRILFSKIKSSELKQVKAYSSTCYVFGNGPSLAKDIKDNLEYFQDKDIFVVNSYVLTDYFSTTRPTFYCLIDPAYFENSHPNKSTFDLIQRCLKALLEKTTWKMYLVIPNNKSYKRRMKEYFSSNKNIEILPICTTSIGGFEWFRDIAYKHNWGMPAPRTVVIAAIFLPVNLGYKEITVLGIDHSWHKNLYVDENNDLFLMDEHFYEPNPQNLHKIINLKTGQSSTVHEQLRSAARAMESHHLLNEYAKTCGCKIYNASSTSFVDAYKRRKIEFDS